MREIPLTRGFVAVVDDEDYEKLQQLSWYADTGASGLVYAARGLPRNGSRRRDKIRMHRQILSLARGDSAHVDHKDGDGLNNRRSNLRKCTPSQNLRNHGEFARLNET